MSTTQKVTELYTQVRNVQQHIHLMRFRGTHLWIF